MQLPADAIDSTDAPTDRPTEVLDVRTLGPPEPLSRTLETLVAASDELVLVQRNDRTPQFLFPKLEERGYRYESLDGEGEIVTVIWAE